MDILQNELGSPVDIEFAADAQGFYLLQCRAQSSVKDRLHVTLPRNIEADRLIFTADKYVTDGYLPNITHIIYVDPAAYEALRSLEEMRAVGRAVGKLNNLISKRRFILMGPGRWGSRGDIKLGVDVTYSDINNTAALIEVAFKRGDYLPDLSFGTHFFQDLVEASISYLPLYPDDPNVVFNHKFLMESPNRLAELLPEYARLQHVLRVIDVPQSTGGQIMQILMSGEEGKAIGMLGHLPNKTQYVLPERRESTEEGGREQYWMWRMRMAEKIGATLDGAHYGVKALYVFGSTTTATARPNSDINLLLHVDAAPEQMIELLAWLDGWSLCLGEINYLRTGHRRERLLDLYFVTDDDLRNEQNLALKIDPRSAAARPLPMMTRKE
jgi:pyruvate, water dikinase